MSIACSIDAKGPGTQFVACNPRLKDITSPLYFHVKRLIKSSKPVTQLACPVHPRLFQIAARLETFSAIKTAKTPHAMPVRTQEYERKRDKRGYSSTELKWTQFQLEASHANSVKLAAEFTDWEKFPLDMIRSKMGVWSITVPLAPGNYSYRFIVDDEWFTNSSTASAASSFEEADVDTIMNVA
jgi:hypothetical protein